MLHLIRLQKGGAIMVETERITLRVPKEIHEWLRKKSFETRESINSLIVKAIQEQKKGAVIYSARQAPTEADNAFTTAKEGK